MKNTHGQTHPLN